MVTANTNPSPGLLSLGVHLLRSHALKPPRKGAVALHTARPTGSEPLGVGLAQGPSELGPGCWGLCCSGVQRGGAAL